VYNHTLNTHDINVQNKGLHGTYAAAYTYERDMDEHCIDALIELGFLSYRQRNAIMEIFTDIIEMNDISVIEHPFAKERKNHLEIMEAINTFLQKYALKKGERTDIKPPAINEYVLANLKENFTKLGMVRNVFPNHIVYDVALCIGSAEKGLRPRINCLAKMTRISIFSIDNIMILGSSRKLWPLKKTENGIEFPEPTLYNLLAERLSERDGKNVPVSKIKSFVAELDTKETAVEKLAEEISAHPYFAGISWPTEADLIKAILDERPIFKGQNVAVINAPDYPDGRRADLARTLTTAIDEYPDIFNYKAGVLAVSSQPFVRNQKQVIKQILPKGVDVDVIGEGIDAFTPKQAMLCLDTFARTIYGSLAYYKAKGKEQKQAKILRETLHKIH